MGVSSLYEKTWCIPLVELQHGQKHNKYSTIFGNIVLIFSSTVRVSNVFWKARIHPFAKIYNEYDTSVPVVA